MEFIHKLFFQYNKILIEKIYKFSLFIFEIMCDLTRRKENINSQNNKKYDTNPYN